MAAAVGDEKANHPFNNEDGTNGTLNEKGSAERSESQAYEVGVLKDGVRTHPQPTADPLDPLNWSSAKKHTILAIVMYL